MATVRECKCCQEYVKLRQKNAQANEVIKCITEHPGFHGVCLNVWVLQAVYYQYRATYGPHVAPPHE